MQFNVNVQRWLYVNVRRPGLNTDIKLYYIEKYIDVKGTHLVYLVYIEKEINIFSIYKLKRYTFSTVYWCKGTHLVHLV